MNKLLYTVLNVILAWSVNLNTPGANSKEQKTLNNSEQGSKKSIEIEKLLGRNQRAVAYLNKNDKHLIFNIFTGFFGISDDQKATEILQAQLVQNVEFSGNLVERAEATQIEDDSQTEEDQRQQKIDTLISKYTAKYLIQLVFLPNSSEVMKEATSLDQSYQERLKNTLNLINDLDTLEAKMDHIELSYIASDLRSQVENFVSLGTEDAIFQYLDNIVLVSKSSSSDSASKSSSIGITDIISGISGLFFR